MSTNATTNTAPKVASELSSTVSVEDAACFIASVTGGTVVSNKLVKRNSSDGHSISIFSKRGTGQTMVKDFTRGDDASGLLYWFLNERGHTKTSKVWTEEEVLICEDFVNAMNGSFSTESFTAPTHKTDEPKTVTDYIVKKNISNRTSFPKKTLDILSGLSRGSTKEELKDLAILLEIGFSPVWKDYPEWIKIPRRSADGIVRGMISFNRSNTSVTKSDGSYWNKSMELKDSWDKSMLAINLVDTKFKKKVVCLTEGITDCCLLLSKKIASVTDGGATSTPKEVDLLALSGKTLYDYPDADIPGLLGSTKRGVAIYEHNERCDKDGKPENKINHVVFWWSNWFVSEKIGLKVSENSFSPADPLNPFKDSIVVKDGKGLIHLNLLKEIQRSYLEKNNQITTQGSLVSNFKVVFKDKKSFVDAGYDFTDFYNEETPEKNKMMDFLTQRAGF